MKRKCDGLGHVPGGAAQRARWALAMAEPPPSESQLATHLLDAWSWGRMSAVEVQRIAACAAADGLNHRDVVVLSKLGSSGAHPNNVNKELIAKVRDMQALEALYSFKARYKIPGMGARIADVEHVALLPHQLFATMYESYHKTFVEQLLGGDLANTTKFWTAMRNHPSMVDHPMFSRKDPFKYAIPISVHGDGVAISGVGKSWSRSVDAYSWAGMLAKGETAISNYLIYVLYSQLIMKESLERFWKILAWSFYWLFVGRWPRKDPDGKDWPEGSVDAERAGVHLAGGYFCTVFCVRGDLEHMAKGFKLQWPTSSQPCSLCHANTSTIPWTETSATATWRGSCWNNKDWLEAHPDGHVLFTKTPGVCLSSFIPDIMHVCHLGIYQYVFASILKWLVCDKLPGTQLENLDLVWNKIQEGYQVHDGRTRGKAMNCRLTLHRFSNLLSLKVFQTKYKYNELRLTMFMGAGGSFPQLKGRAAEVKGLAHPLCKCVEDFLDDGSQVHKWMKKLMLAIVQIEEILTLHCDEYVLPADVAREFLAGCDAIVKLNTALGKHFHDRGDLLFNHTIKFHYLQHVGLIAAYINPRLAWCYSGEDLLQRVRSIARSSQHGTKQGGVPPKVMRKYAQGLSFKLGGGRFLR